MILRWLPAAILGLVVVAASGAVLRSTGPSARDAVVDEAVDVPVFSARRSLDPLLRRSADARLVARLDDFVASQPDDTCLSVRTGDLAYGHRADDPQTPASLQKLLTATAALVELGPDATYETQVLGFAGTSGVVPGDVFLRGGGDPILATAAYVARERNQPQIFSDIARLADAVVAAGITSIEGAVVGDDSRYDGVRYNPLWPSRFLAQGQIGPLSALSVNDGFAYFPDQTGSFGAAPDPPQYAAQVLTDLLRERGVVVGADARSGVAPADTPVLATHSSPPMSQIVTEMVQESDNNTAELVLKEVGLAVAGAGSSDAGGAAVSAVLGEDGIDVEDAVVADGSGLAAEDRVTCTLVMDVLDHDPTEGDLDSALAVAGESGTLAGRWLDTELVGRIRGKTGTLNQVAGLAGRAETADGDEAQFALLVNLPPEEFVGDDVTGGQRRLAEILTAHPDLPDVSALRPSSDDGG